MHPEVDFPNHLLKNVYCRLVSKADVDFSLWEKNFTFVCFGITANRQQKSRTSLLFVLGLQQKDNKKSRAVWNAVLVGQGVKRMRHEEDEYDNDDFVVEDEEEPDWRQALKSVTRYDPSKYAVGLMPLLVRLHHWAFGELCLPCTWLCHGCQRV